MDRDTVASTEYLEASLAEYEAAGDDVGRLGPMQNLAASAVGTGDYQRAISLIRQKIARTDGLDTYGRALAVGLLGFALAGNGENEEARQSFEQSLEMCSAHGYSRLDAETLCGLAELVRAVSPREALEYYRQSVDVATTIGYQGLVARCVLGIAAIASAGGRARDGAALLAFVAGAAERQGGLGRREQDEFNPAVASARDALGNDAFERRGRRAAVSPSIRRSTSRSP